MLSDIIGFLGLGKVAVKPELGKEMGGEIQPYGEERKILVRFIASF